MMGCPYPAFYSIYADHFDFRELPLDSAGLCIFHSSDTNWKLEQGFRDTFHQLLLVLEHLAETEKENIQSFYRFSGFIFPDAETPLLLENIVGNIEMDFSHAQFAHGLTISNCRFARLNISKASFKGPVSLMASEIKRETNGTKTTFPYGIKLSNCSLGGYISFDDCTFDNPDKVTQFALQILNCPSLEASDFSDSSFKGNVTIRDVVFTETVSFDRCEISEEFYCHNVQIGGVFSFKESEFLKRSNPNPRYCCVSFVNIDILEEGQLTFEGIAPMSQMVRGEMQLEFVPEFAGKVSFENFDLNKMAPASKLNALRLSALGRVNIGSGCLKYKHRTEIKTIQTDETNIALYEELARTFASYYSAHNHVNLGVELVERTTTSIQFFYFSDENISEETFLERFEDANSTFWNTGGNKAKTKLEKITSSNHLQLDSMIGLWQICFKLLLRFQSNNLTQQDLDQIASLTSPDSTPIINASGIEAGTRQYFKIVIQNFDIGGNMNIKNLNVNATGSPIVIGNHNSHIHQTVGLTADDFSKFLENFKQQSTEFKKSVFQDVEEIERMDENQHKMERMDGLRIRIVENGATIFKNLDAQSAFDYLKQIQPLL